MRTKIPSARCSYQSLQPTIIHLAVRPDDQIAENFIELHLAFRQLDLLKDIRQLDERGLKVWKERIEVNLPAAPQDESVHLVVREAEQGQEPTFLNLQELSQLSCVRLNLSSHSAAGDEQ